MLKRIIYMCLLVLCMYSCSTKQDVFDTGISKAKFDGTIMQYLRNDDYNWKGTVEMIERGGLTDLFEGRVDTLKEITFLAPTSYSILRCLLDSNKTEVSQLPVQFCRETILKHVIKGKILKDDLPFRDKQYYVYDAKQPATGFKELRTVGGKTLRAYLEKTPLGTIPDNGPVVMFLYSMSAKLPVPLASPNIQPNNGVVHSLGYNYFLNNI